MKNHITFYNRLRLFKAGLLPFVLLCAVFWCSQLQAFQKVDAVVSILPQKFFVEKIGGDRVNVSVMVEPGADPASYEPRPRQMVMLGRAEVYFAVGVPFEKSWLPRFKEINPRLDIVPTQEGIRLFPMGHEKGRGKARHPSDKEIMDPHVWLSPPLVMIQARNIVTALIKKRPEDAEYFRRRYLSFVQSVAGLDLEIFKMFQASGVGQARKGIFMVYHPCWGYFARAYGLKQIAIEQEGKEPKPAYLAKLAGIAKKLGIESILIQPQYSKRSAQAVADSIGAVLVTADPLAYDWAANLLSVAGKIKKALK